MKTIAILAALMLTPVLSAAQTADPEISTPEFAPITAEVADLEAYRWKNRVVVVFANTAEDPAFRQQMQNFEQLWYEMAARDVVVITDTDPGTLSPLREKLRPRGFMLVLIDIDGSVALRKPFAWDVRELSRSIDKTPLRREELRARRSLP